MSAGITSNDIKQAPREQESMQHSAEIPTGRGGERKGVEGALSKGKNKRVNETGRGEARFRARITLREGALGCIHSSGFEYQTAGASLIHLSAIHAQPCLPRGYARR